jgi:hypothetical protein
MENISFVTDNNGNKVGLLINLKPKKKISVEYLEDIEDIISHEFLINEPSVDYKSSIEKIIKKKKSENV